MASRSFLGVEVDGHEGEALGLAMRGELAKTTKEIHEGLKRASTGAMRDQVGADKELLRIDVQVLGPKMARTWQAKVYPAVGTSDDPAGVIVSKAPDLIDIYGHGATIVPHGGSEWLAIPTNRVPLTGRGGRARPMTPVEVEAAFNQDLSVAPDPHTGHLLAFVSAVSARSGRGVRKATARRVAQGRAVERVLMFVLVKQVIVGKRIRGEELLNEIAARFPEAYDARFTEYLAAEMQALGYA